MHPNTSKKVAEELSHHDVEILDAPVTGSEPQAIEGTLTFMVGGKKELFEKCMELFLVMGKKAYYMGGNGQGSYMKLANNSMAAINLLGILLKPLPWPRRQELTREVFAEVVSGGGARSAMAENKAAKVINRDFRPHFMAQVTT